MGVLDEIDAAELLSHAELAASLQKMLDQGARLSAYECKQRFLRSYGTEAFQGNARSSRSRQGRTHF